MGALRGCIGIEDPAAKMCTRSRPPRNFSSDVKVPIICSDDIVEAHCYFVDIGRTDREQIRSRINNNDCRTFRPRRPLSTAYRTKETAV